VARYKAREFFGPGILHPVIDITLRLGSRVTRHPALIDSGADGVLVPAAFVEDTEADYSRLDGHGHVMASGGPSSCRFAPGIVEWSGVEICKRFRVSAPPSQPHLAVPFVILGREDFFRLFVVTFHWHLSPPEFEIRRAPVVRRRAGARLSLGPSGEIEGPISDSVTETTVAEGTEVSEQIGE
jgi:predicted aspartyl protease